MVNKTSGWKMSIACTAFLMMCSLVLSACSVGSIPKQEENCDTSTTPDVCETAAGGQETTPQVNNEIIDMAMAAYRDVLLGKSNYFDAPTAENLNINQLYDIDSIFPATPTQFVLQDLDNDGLPEVIVQIDMNNIENFGSLILHYEDGQVVGYYLWSRAFGDLKQTILFIHQVVHLTMAIPALTSPLSMILQMHPTIRLYIQYVIARLAQAMMKTVSLSKNIITMV